MALVRRLRGLFRRLFASGATLVSGDGPVAAALCERLQRDGRAVRRLGQGGLTAGLLKRAQTLILADPGDPVAEVSAVFDLAASRPNRGAPLRLILAHRGPWPEGLPGPETEGPVRLEGLALEDEAARALLAAHPLHSGCDPLFGQVPHLLIAGTAPPAMALLVQAMRLAHYGPEQAVFTLAADPPDAWRDAVLSAYPQAPQCCRLRFTGLDEPNLDGAPPVTGVWVLLDPPESGLDPAQTLAARLLAVQGVAPPIYLEVGAARPSGDIADWDGQTRPISWLATACDPRALLDGRNDRLALVIHEHYRDSIEAQGRDPGTEAAGRPWEGLAGSYRDASRHQADHLWAKLAATDGRAIPLDEARGQTHAFAPLEVERLAEVEHRRWAADRYLAGWTYAPVRDNSRRHHPQLIPYANLSEPMKDLDRFVVRLVPTLLARSELALVPGLVIGVAQADPEVGADRRLRRLVHDCLGRLAARFPDRGLILASTLDDPGSRLLAQIALDDYAAALWMLCPPPIPKVLARALAADDRTHLLELVARAERRIPLAGPEGLADWLGQRAAVLILPGTLAAPAQPGRQVRLDPAAAAPQWGFEY
jgi:hypothetical protein